MNSYEQWRSRKESPLFTHFEKSGNSNPENIYIKCPFPDCNMKLSSPGFSGDRSVMRDELFQHLIDEYEFRRNGYPGHGLPFTVSRWVAALTADGFADDARQVALDWLDKHRP